MGLRRVYGRHLRYWVWRLANPTKPYELYYAEVILKKVRRDGHHVVVGKRSRAVRSSTELRDLMVAHGLKPEHRFVDYGCGSLRLGKAIVAYLQPENFHGVDVTQEFLDMGIEFLGPELAAEKKPFLDVIGPEGLRRARERKPDYIATWHVASKVPDSSLAEYFGHMIGLMTKSTQLFVQFPNTDVRRRMNSLNWSFAEEDIRRIVRALDPALKVDILELIPRNSAGVTESYALIRYLD